MEQLEFFFAANGITSEEKQRATFLTITGPSAYKLLRSILAPAKPADKTFEELVAVLTAHYSPKPSEIVSRYKFYNRSRKSGESVNTFISEIRDLVRFCNFEQALDAMIRDRLVCGINDDQIQKHLLSEGNQLTLSKAATLAQAMKAATKDSQLLQPQSVQPLQLVKEKQGTRKMPCYCCTKLGHSPANCRFKTARCHNCQKLGHIRKACMAQRSNRKV